jgi:transcriptional regulator GlxA family with amidase domain
VSYVAALALIDREARKQIESNIIARLTLTRVSLDSPAMSGSLSGGQTKFTGRPFAEWSSQVRRGASWLRENYMHPISVADAAKVVELSERTFLRRFRTETARTPSEYLLEVRLGVVCRLLTRTRIPIDEIARCCGMGGGERLAKIFRRRLTITPREYRESKMTN